MAVFNQDDLIKSINEDDTQDSLLPDQVKPEENVQEGYGKQFAGNVIYSNPIASRMYLGAEDKEISNPSYDRFSQLKDTEWEPLMNHFIYSDSDEEMDQQKQRLRKEMELANTVMNSGWVGTIGMLTGGIADPTLAVPIVGAVSKVRTAAQVGKSVLQGSALGAGAMGASEAALHGSQELRTPQQSMVNVAAGAVLGGVLGGAISGVVAGKYKLSESIVKEILSSGELPKLKINSAGAMEYQLSDASIAKMPDWVAKAMTVPGLRPPIIEGLTSNSPFLRDVATRLMENNVIKKRNLSKGANVAESVAMETKLKIDTNQTLQYRKGIEDIYAQYLGYAEKPKGGIQSAISAERMYGSSKKQGKMTAKEFNEQVGTWVRRTEKSGNKFIDDAVERTRKDVYEVQNKKMEALSDKSIVNILKEQRKLNDMIKAMKHRLASETDTAATERILTDLRKQRTELVLPRNPNVFEEMLSHFELKGRESYFTIMADKGRMTENRARVEGDVTDWLVQSEGMERAEANSVTTEYIDKLMGLDGDTALSALAKKHLSPDSGIGFVKERTSNVPDTLLEPGLVNDVVINAGQYLDNSNKLIRFQEFLNDMGVNNVAELKAMLGAEKQVVQAKLSKSKTYNADMDNVSKSYVQNEKFLDDFIAISLGQYSKRTGADRALRWLRDFNYVRLMGFIVLSSITDIAMPILKHGLGNTLVHGYGPILKNIATGARKVVHDDLAHIHAALDLEMNNTLRSIIDPDFINSHYGRPANVGIGAGGKAKDFVKNRLYNVEQGTKYLTDKFGKINFMDYWNLFHKRLAGNVAKSRIIKDIKNYDGLSSYEKTYLNSIGIGEQHISKLKNQLDKHAYDYKGAFITNTEEWTDDVVRDIFQGAMIKEIDSTIITPGRGDIARIQQKHEIAKLMMQFKGFFSAMTTKVLISGSQRLAMGDLRVLQGVAALLSLGALQYNIRTIAAGKEPNNSIDNLLLESYDRSGLGGLMGAIVLPVSGKFLGYNAGSRYTQQTLLEYPWGPTGSLVKDLWKVSQDSMHGEWDDKTSKAAMHLFPYQNWFILRTLFDELNDLDRGKK